MAKALADEEETKTSARKKTEAARGASRDFEYKDLTGEAKAPKSEGLRKDLDFILDIPGCFRAAGQRQLLINELLQLGQGSVID
jgi:flagellar motor switch protein FliN/FliY